MVSYFSTRTPSNFHSISDASEDESFVLGQVQSLKSSFHLKVWKEKAGYGVGEHVVKR